MQSNTINLDNAQLAQFTACGLIVVDGGMVIRNDGCEEARLHDHHVCQCYVQGRWQYVAPELWRKLTEPCATCFGFGVEHAYASVGCGGPCEHPCPNPDCDRGRQVVTLTRKGTVDNSDYYEPFPAGVVTLGRFTIELHPQEDGKWIVEFTEVK